MTPEERKVFLAERMTGLGGSDAQHYLDIDPYGCARLCWYQKRGEPENYPVKGNEKVMNRGNKLEQIILDEYTIETGRAVRREAQHLRDGRHSFMVAHVDGIDDRGWIVEAKTMGREIWYQTRRDGIPQGYVAQGQHYCYVNDAPGVAFAVLWADGWEFTTFDVPRDDEMIEICIEAAEELWERVQMDDPPDRLDPKFKQCRRCAYRTTCQGNALLDAAIEGNADSDQTLDLTTLIELRDIRDEAKAAYEAESEVIKEQLGSRTAVDGIGGRATYSTVKTNRLDKLHLQADHPKLVEKYTKEAVSRPLRVFSS